MLVNLVWHTDCSADRRVSEWTPAATGRSFLHHARISCRWGLKTHAKAVRLAPGELFINLPITAVLPSGCRYSSVRCRTARWYLQP